MMDIDDYVLTIFEELNISRAAKKIKISQPALSSALTKLEKNLGYYIFDRKSSPLSLTAEGRIYIDFLKSKRNLENNLNKQIDDLHNPLHQEIYIGSPTAYIKPYILPAITELIQDFPLCKIKICEGTLQFLTTMAKENKLDLFISTANDDSGYFCLEEIADEHIYLCVPHPLRIDQSGLPIFSDLSGEYFIQLGESQPLQKNVNKFFKKINFAPAKTIQVDQVSSGIDLVSSGCGICFATSSSLCMKEFNVPLYTYKLPDNIFQRKIYVASLTQNKSTILQENFIRILKEKGDKINENL